MTKQAKMILLIDDDTSLLVTLSDFLSFHGYEVVTADSGEQGLEKLSSVSPDLIVLDVNLPSMSGHQVCRRLRRDEDTADVPVIMLTSSEGSDDMLEGLNAGATDYIPKDEFAIEHLITTLRSMDLVE